jgi:hypothetical protein
VVKNRETTGANTTVDGKRTRTRSYDTQWRAQEFGITFNLYSLLLYEKKKKKINQGGNSSF